MRIIAFLLLLSIGFSQLNLTSFFVDSFKKTFAEKNKLDNGGEEESKEKSKEEVEENLNFFQYSNISSLNKLLVTQNKLYFNSSKFLYSNPFKQEDIKPPQIC